ncbi:amino acid adenylation domain-containing protein [Bradyrhizobium ontarionense]|uniref:Amino acid adenylation domain-containing protein n=2 Tax=Bradyrhizobium ontarionense TaxID=2898149 RepID=A0ABY3R7K1_9BRAD|nr:non-ribosomal peptide synthetase [Bradyrhizobium sp. A19]UFZ03305.1 amino acid adenylation domain-containing protein [Bradyrhizobium sp. A19]
MASERSDAIFPAHEALASSIGQVFESHALVSPNRVAFSFIAEGDAPTSVLTCGDLHRRALAIGRTLSRRLAPGERVLLVLPAGPDFLSSFLGTVYAGLVAVPLPVPRFPVQVERLAAVSANAGASALIATDELDLGDLRDLPRFDPTNLDPQADGWTPHWIGGDAIAFLQYTSGSTGTPRGVKVSHRNLLSNSALLRQRFGYDGNSIAVTWLPPSHDMGLIEALLQPPLHGGQTIAMSPLTFLRRPERWLKAISKFRASHAGAPDFAYAQCVERTTPAMRHGLDLSSWKVAYVAAEPIRPETLLRFGETFVPHGFDPKAFHASYGLAENTLLVADGPAEHREFCADALEEGAAVAATMATRRKRALVPCGKPDQQSVLRIVDPETARMLPEQRIGEIWISGPSVAAGYWNLPDETQQVFGATLSSDSRSAGPAFLRTGDLGFLSDGRLYITGRLKDLIVLSGRNIYPQDVERCAAAAHPAIRRAPAAFGTFGADGESSDRLVVVCEIRPDDLSGCKAIASAIRSSVATSIEAELSVVMLVAPGTIRFTTSGKIMRQDCRRRYLLGTLAPLYTSEIGAAREPQSDDASDPLHAFLHRRLSITDFSETSRLTELGIDSLAGTELAHMLEAEHGIAVSAVELLQSTVGELSARIARADRGAPKPSDVGPSGSSLVHGQNAMWFLHRLWTSRDPFQLSMTAKLRGDVDVARLRGAFDRLVDRHIILRSTFPQQDSVHQPGQSISSTPPRLVVRSELALDNALLTSLAEQPFDLTRSPPFRAFLLVGNGEHTLLLCVHHIAIDFWSLRILVRDLAALYRDEHAALPRLGPHWLPAQMEMRALADSDARRETYWREMLERAPLDFELPLDHSRPAQRNFSGGRTETRIDGQTLRAALEFAQARNVSLATVLFSVFVGLCHRYTGEQDVVIGVPVAGRESPLSRDFIGLLARLTPVRVQLAGGAIVDDVVHLSDVALRGAQLHQPFAIDDAVRQSSVEGVTTAPLKLLFNAYQVSDETQQSIAALAVGVTGPELDLDGLILTPMERPPGRVHQDMVFNVFSEGNSLRIVLHYAAELFDSGRMQRLIGHYCELLHGFLAQPRGRLARIPLLGQTERQHLLGRLAGLDHQRSPNATLHGLFEEQARRTPTAIALIAGDVSMSYRELDQAAGRLAYRLREIEDIRVGDAVGIHLERDARLVVAMLAVLKTGAAYVPLDPNYPAQRLRGMVADADIRKMIGGTDSHGLGIAPIAIPANGGGDGPLPIPVPLSADAPAYILFTSGSTGRPKGVIIAHRAAAALVHWASEQFGSDLQRVFAGTSASFDLSIFEIFGPLCTGGTVILAPSLLALPELLESTRPTLISGVPSVMVSVLERVRTLPSLRSIALAGERLTTDLSDRVLEACPGARLFDLYGPTEVTTYATAAQRRPGAEATIGTPLPCTRVYLLDEAMEPVPQGVPGEIWLGGDRLAIGYAKQPGWTADRFLPDPFSSHPGARMYRTGDRGCFNAAGELCYLGRLDRQVKIRGYRVEPDEVEILLSRHPAVAQAAVVVVPGPDQTLRMTAWLVLKSGAELAEIQSHAASHCPAYLLPSFYVSVNELPKTPTGKLDRNALMRTPVPLPETGTSSNCHDGPFVAEAAICMARALHLPEVDSDDNFFHIGGHSLAAVRFCKLLGDALGRSIPVITPFDHPTPRSIAAYLNRTPGKALPAETERRQPAASQLPLSFTQQQIWYVYRADEAAPTYNMAMLLRFDRPVTVEALRMALHETIRRHAALRCRLVDDVSPPHQIVVAAPPIRIPEIDLSQFDADAEAGLTEAADRFARAAFDLRNDLPIRATAFLMPTGRRILGLAVHHMMIDGASLKLIVDDLLTGLAGLAGETDGERPVAFDDASAPPCPSDPGEEILADDRAFWRSKLLGAEPSRLSAERGGLRGSSIDGRTFRFKIPFELSAGSTTLATGEDATTFMALLAAFAALIGRITCRDEAVLALPIALRHDPGLDQAVGMFVQPVVVRIDLSGNPSFRFLLRRVRQAVLEAIAHSRLPYEQVIEAAGAARDGTADPLYSILFAIQNGPARDTQIGNLSASCEPLDTGTARSELTVLADPGGNGIDCAFEYRSASLDPTTIERLALAWNTLLAAAVAAPEAGISELPIVSPEHRDLQLTKWNSSPAPDSDLATLHELVLRQASATPGAIALTDADGSRTYRELVERASTYAAVLREHHVGADQMIGLCLPRRSDTVAAMIGIMMAGAAWLPLDPDYPALRLQALADTAAVSLVIAEPKWYPLLFADRRIAPPPMRVDPVDVAICSSLSLAYAMSTSGSTGKPKVVGIAHDSAVNFLNWAIGAFEPEERAIVPWCTSIAFDLTIFEIFLPLSTGGEVVVVRDILSLNDLPARDRLTMINTIPSGMEASLRLGPAPPRVRTICLAGEPLSQDLVERLLRGSHARRVVDLYGPTEATTYATFIERRAGEPPSVGRPLGGMTAYVLDQHLQLLPIGIIGELYLGGRGLARGYIGAPGATADRFVPHPFEGGERLYRTGDRARFLENGRIELLGRVDHQVKLRGFRIELGEVERVLARHPDVADAAAIVSATDSGDKKLIAFVAGASRHPDPVALVDWTAQHLPRFSVPAACIVLDELPRLPNGKLDRAVMAHLVPAQQTVARDEDGGALTGVIIALWTDLVGRPPLPGSTFFEDGGNSLHAVSLIARLGSICGAKLSLRDFLSNPTVSGIEAIARKGRRWQGVPMLPAPLPTEPAEEGPLSHAQQQIWLFGRLAPASPVYNVSYVMRLGQTPQRDRLRAALRELVQRHPALRTSFRQVEGEPRQVVQSGVEIALEEAWLDGATAESDAINGIRVMLCRPFDLAQPPLLRAMLASLPNGNSLLAISVHHIIVDAWSLNVLLCELGKLYSGKPVPPPPSIGPIEFAAWEQSWLGTPGERRAFHRWQDRLAGLQPTLRLQAPAGHGDFAGITLKRVLPPALRDQIRRVALATDATLFHAVLGAFALLLRSLSGKDELIIGLPVTMRRDPKWDGVVGFFSNTVPLRLDLTLATDARALLQQVRDSVLDAHDWGWLPLSRIADAWRVARDDKKPELLDAIFVMHDGTRAGKFFPTLSASYLPVELGVARCSLMLSVLDESDGLILHLETSLVERADSIMKDLASMMERLAEAQTSSPAAMPHWPAPSDEPLPKALASHSAVADWHVVSRDNGQARAYIRLRPGEPYDKHPELRALAPELFFVSCMPRHADGAVDVEALEQSVVRPASLPSPTNRVTPELRPSRLALVEGPAFIPPPDRPRHLPDALRRAAALRPDNGTLFITRSGVAERLTYPQLLTEARGALAALRRLGAQPGSSAILQFDRPRQHLPVFWGLLLGAMRPLTVAIPPVYEPDQAIVQKLVDAWHQLGHAPILCSATTADGLRGLRQRGILPGAQIFEIDRSEADGAPEAEQPYDDQVAFFQLSSGSTGTSKVIPITHQGIVHQALASAGARRDCGGVSLNWLPLDHVVPILTYHLTDVVLGRDGIQLDTAAVLANPLIWLDMLDQYRVTDTWSPNFGFRLLLDALKSAPQRHWDLSSLRRWMNAGELVTSATMRELATQAAKFGLPASALQPAFGMAETCTCITYELDFDPVRSVRWARRSSMGTDSTEFSDHPAPDTTGFVSLGAPVAGVALRIADAAGLTAREGQIGRLQFQGPVITPGYLDNAAANAAAFQGDGWFDSGDLGFVADGQLYVTGRDKEVLIINGVNYSCQELEEIAADAGGVLDRKTAAVGFRPEGADTEALVIFFVPQPAVDIGRTARGITVALSRRIGVVPARVIPLSDTQFPRTTSGKIQRVALRRGLTRDLQKEDRSIPAAPVHRVVWRRSRQEFVRPPPRHAVVFGDRSGIAETIADCLRRAGSRCTLVSYGSAFDRRGLDDFVVRPSSRDDHALLWAALEAPADTIMHLATVDPPTALVPTSSALREMQDVGLFALLAIAQSLPGDASTEIVLVSRGLRVTPFDQQVAWPHATMLGLARTIPLEKPGLTVRSIDMSLSRSTTDHQIIISELAAPATEPEVCLRGSVRLVPRLEANVVTDLLPDYSGRWIVAGGTGSVGTMLSNHLRSKHRGVLHPLSRKARPSNGEIKADVNDLDTLRTAVKRVEDETGEHIAGVFHLAGDLELTSIDELTPHSLWQAIETRLAGGNNLGRLFDERPEVRFIVFSSTTGLLGGALAGAYAAANSGLDALVEHLRLRGFRAQTIRWSAWSGLGLSQTTTAEARRANGLLDIPADAALAILDALGDETDVCVGLDERHPRLRSILIPADPRLPLHDQRLPASPARPTTPPAGELENAIARVWQDVLKLEHGLDREASFFELGGSSVQLALVQLRLEQMLERPVPLRSVFSHPSISRLADYLGAEETHAQATAPIVARRRRRQRASPGADTTSTSYGGSPQ